MPSSPYLVVLGLSVLLTSLPAARPLCAADPIQKVWESTPFNEVAYGLAASPSGKQFAIAGRLGTIVVFDTESQKVIKQIEPDNQFILAMRYSPDSSVLAAVGPKQLVLYRTDNWKQLRAINLPARCGYLSFHPTRPWIAVAGQGTSLDIYDVVDQKIVRSFKADLSNAQGVQFSNDGRYLYASVTNAVVGSPAYVLRRYDLQTDAMDGFSYIGDTQARRVILSPDGESLLVNVPQDGASVLFKEVLTRTMHVRHQWQANTEIKMGTAFLPDGKSILTARQGQFDIWQPGKKEPIASIPSDDAGSAYEIVPIPGTRDYLMCHERSFRQITRWRTSEEPLSP